MLYKSCRTYFIISNNIKDAEDNYLIVVTHVTPTSTKIPVIFSGDTILVGSVGTIKNYEEMNKTI